MGNNLELLLNDWTDVYTKSKQASTLLNLENEREIDMSIYNIAMELLDEYGEVVNKIEVLLSSPLDIGFSSEQMFGVQRTIDINGTRYSFMITTKNTISISRLDAHGYGDYTKYFRDEELLKETKNKSSLMLIDLCEEYKNIKPILFEKFNEEISRIINTDMERMNKDLNDKIETHNRIKSCCCV